VLHLASLHAPLSIVGFAGRATPAQKAAKVAQRGPSARFAKGQGVGYAKGLALSI